MSKYSIEFLGGEIVEEEADDIQDAITNARMKRRLISYKNDVEPSVEVVKCQKVVPDIPEKVKFGFFSETAAGKLGSLLYKRPDGTEVDVTAIYDTKEEGEKFYHWNDKVCVGEVTRFIRKKSYGRYGMEPMLS